MGDARCARGARNRSITEQLRESDAAGERRCVEYFVLGPRSKLRAFGAELKAIGFRTRSAEGQLVASEVLEVDAAVLEERTAFFELEAAKHGLEFDGWGVALGEEVDPDKPPPAFKLPEPGGVWTVELGDGRFGYVHVLGGSKSAGLFCQALKQTTEGVIPDVRQLDWGEPLYRQPVLFDMHMAGMTRVGAHPPDYAAIAAKGIYAKWAGPSQLDHLVGLGLLAVNSSTPPDFSPEAIAAYERRRIDILSALEPIRLTDWQLFEFAIGRTGKARTVLNATPVPPDDPRLLQAYPFGTCRASDVAAALSGRGVDAFTLEDRVWTV